MISIHCEIHEFPFSNPYSQGIVRNFVNRSLQTYIKLSSSGVYDSNHLPSNLLKYSTGAYASEITPSSGQWLQMEIINYTVDLTGYSLYGHFPARIRNWNFTLSSNGHDWKYVHSKTGEEINTGPKYQALENNVRFFRWICTGASTEYNHMNFHQIDIYGVISHHNCSESCNNLYKLGETKLPGYFPLFHDLFRIYINFLSLSLS